MCLTVAKIKGLILPQGMGDSHKVMIQYKGEGEPEFQGIYSQEPEGKAVIYSCNLSILFKTRSGVCVSIV